MELVEHVSSYMLKNRFVIWIISILILFVVGVLAILIFSKNSTQKISNFNECIEAGNPAMENYPRQCRTPGGELFVEDIS